MTLSSLLTQSVTILRRGASTSDAEGNWVPAADVSEVVKARVEQTPGTEGFAGAERTERLWRGYFLPSVALNPDDRVQVGSRIFEVLGPPADQSGLAGVHHVVADLRFVGED